MEYSALVTAATDINAAVDHSKAVMHYTILYSTNRSMMSIETKYSEHVPLGTFYTQTLEFVFAYLSVARTALQRSPIF